MPSHALTLAPSHVILDAVYQALLHAPEAILIVDSNETIIFANQAALRLWQLKIDHMIGQHIQTLINDRLEYDRLPHAEHRSWESWVQTSDGIQYPVRIKSMPFFSGEKTYLSLFIRTIDDLIAQREERHVLSLVANETDAAILVTNAHEQIIYANAGFHRLFGYDSKVIIGQVLSTLFTNINTSPQALSNISRHLKSGIEHTEQVLLYDHEGEAVWVSAVLKPVFNQSGRLRHVILTLNNINDVQLHQTIQHKVLQAIASKTPLPDIMELICLQIQNMAPEALPVIYKLDRQTTTLYPLAVPDTIKSYLNMVGGISIGPNQGCSGTAAWSGKPVISDDISHDPRWETHREIALSAGLRAASALPIKARDGHVLGAISIFYRTPTTPSTFHLRLLGVCVDLCALALEREEVELHIHRLAFYDTLTGLPNRSYLQQQITNLMRHMVIQGSHLALLFIDIDHFKHINDSLGHLAGDYVLAEIANRFKQYISPKDLISRLGGDEFVLVLPNADSVAAEQMAKRLISILKEPINLNGIHLQPSISIGISLCPQDGTTQADLLKHADMAMYQAKLNGRSTYAFYDSTLNQQAQERLTLEHALRHALENDLLELHYQPQVFFDTGELAGLEALIRWHHPDLGEISPARFIPLAEQSGLIIQLEQWALKEACQQISVWEQQDFHVPNVSVNISPLHFKDVDLPKNIDQILTQYQLDPRLLILEITEGIMLDSHDDTLNTIQALSERGIRLAIDDFGTGYASLGYFQHFPIAEIKLDKSFVKDLAHDESARALVIAIIRMGNKLDIDIVAEGVETEAQRSFLEDEGCEIGQGFFFSRPLSAEALGTWVHLSLPKFQRYD